MQNWTQWQHEVLRFLQADFEEALQQLTLDDVDWVAWRRFFDEGRSPRSAVNRALERDL